MKARITAVGEGDAFYPAADQIEGRMGNIAKCTQREDGSYYGRFYFERPVEVIMDGWIESSWVKDLFFKEFFAKLIDA